MSHFYQQIVDQLSLSSEVAYTLQPHEDDLDQAKKRCEILFSEEAVSVIECLKCVHPGLHLYWTYKSEEEHFIHGEFNVYHPLVAFSRNDASFIGGLPDEPDYLCYVNHHPHMADNIFTLAGFNSSMNGVVLGYSDGLTVYDLTIGWEEYQYWLAEALGYSHWHLYFCKRKSSELVRYLNEVHFPKMMHDLTVCFPQKDLVPLEPMRSAITS